MEIYGEAVEHLIHFRLGTIHILRKHNLGLFWPPPPINKQMLCTENKQ